MDEIEYKLKTNNSVLIVNAIDKLITTIKSKYKVGERQKFVLENEELKFLREKCSAQEQLVSLTACQGLLTLVEHGVLEIAHTMSTVVTLLPSTHNYSAIISSMAGLLVLDLKSRLIPGQPYKCQFSLRSPRHPFITVLEKNKEVEDDILAQMHALCTHPDYIVASNSLELLRPVFLWLTCSPHRSSVKPWQLMLTLPQTDQQFELLMSCIACQKISSPKSIEYTYAAYSVVVDAAIYQQRVDDVVVFLPVLARVSGELVAHGRDPRGCYNLIERCFALDNPALRYVAGLVVMLLAQNLITTSAFYLRDLFNLCLNIISKYEYSKICLASFVGLSLQWLHLPSYLTSEALKVASKIFEIHESQNQLNSALYMANLKSNKAFMELAYSDKKLFVYFKLLENWERLRDNPANLNRWFNKLMDAKVQLKLDIFPFFVGVIMSKEASEVKPRAVRALTSLVMVNKGLSVTMLPILQHKISNDPQPGVILECLKGLPLMAVTKENVPLLIKTINKLKTGKDFPASIVIMMYDNLAETQIRCFPYLQEMLVDTGAGRHDRWEADISRAIAVQRICEKRASTHGLELVSVISYILNRCTDGPGAAATAMALGALGGLWRGNAVAPPSTWRALEPRLGKDSRPLVQIQLCKLLGEIPALRVPTPEYDKLLADAARKLWSYIADSNQPHVVSAACEALGDFRTEDYKLKDVPQIYRRGVKLPPSYCKTPIDAARKPEDVLDYIPSEVWPEVFKYTNQDALSGVQKLVSKLMEREIKGYRSGVYQVEQREPQDMGRLPVASVVGGMMECFRKQMTSPTYDCPEKVMLAILNTLTEEFPKPLPPLDLTFLHEAFRRGNLWQPGCLKLAIRQAGSAASARRMVDSFLQGIEPGISKESDIMLFFEYLPLLCRNMPPNDLRSPIEKCLAESFYSLPRVKPEDPEDLLFIKQLNMIKKCLECDRIHDANRTLLSLTVENYFVALDDEHIVWPAYADTCRALSTKYLERMTSTSGWWEVTGQLLRKSTAVRCLLATEGDAPLLWLNESIDAHAANITEQEFSLRHMAPALLAADVEHQSTREWFLQLLARSQVAFHETEDQSSKLYFCDVFALAVLVFSGHWSFEPDPEPLLTRADARRALLPAAIAALMAMEGWRDCTAQMLEWLCHTRDHIKDAETARCCQRALLALRHSEPFTSQGVWARIETDLVNTTRVEY